MRYFNICMFMILLAICSCTDADNTGALNGQWQIVSISDNGQEVSKPQNLFLAFQGEVIKARIADQENYNYTYITGKFIEKQDSLILSFYVDNPVSKQRLEGLYMFEGEPEDQRFGCSVSSDVLLLQRASRQWKLRKY